MANSGSLPRKKVKAIAALLTESHVVDAALVAGVGHRTLHRWLQEDEPFRAALAEAESQMLADSARSIAAASREAIDELRAIFQDKDATRREKIAAAKAILAHTPPIRLLGSIEQALAELQGNRP